MKDSDFGKFTNEIDFFLLTEISIVVNMFKWTN